MATNNNTGPCTVKCLMAVAKNTVEVRDKELGELEADNVRVKTTYSMVSTGTELHRIMDTHTVSRGFPVMTGYIMAGEVVGVGANVTELALGDKVLGGPAHFETIDIPAKSVIKLPDGIALEKAVCTPLLAISIRGVRAGNVRLGDSVAVFGQGVIGAFATHLSKLSGGHPVIAIDPVKARRDAALKLGADHVIDPIHENVVERIKDLTGGAGVNVSIEATASPKVIGQLPEITAKQGRIVVLGGIHGTPDIDLYTFFQKSNQTMIGCGSAYPGDYPFDEATNKKVILDMIMSGMIDPEPVVTHRVPYTEGPEVYRMLIEEKDKAIGVQFTW